ncbi:MAG: hypothetical protein GQ570_11200 [Helicobacteraceae bacterium]|nr:hypothetical protein [Helicobacteraceae bacterium]
MGGIGTNTVTNMAEDLTMMVGYSVVNTFLHEQLKEFFPDEVDEDGKPKMNVALEVLSGGASYLFMSAMMEIIRREEKFIEYLFAGGEALIAVLYARNEGYLKKMMNKVSGLKGVKAISKMKIFNSQQDHQNTFITQVYQAMQTIMNGRTASQNVTQTIGASNGSMDTALNREDMNFKMAQAQNENFNNSMTIKMATANFTVADKTMLQRVIGRTNFATVPLDVDELNSIREFMITTDSNGKMTGLSTAFMQMLSGLGYMNK